MRPSITILEIYKAMPESFKISPLKVNHTHSQAALDARTSVAVEAVAQAAVENIRQRNAGGARLHHETATRAKWRAFFDAASALPGVAIAVSFIKDSGTEPRTLLCRPTGPASDGTKRYVTVFDLDEQAPRRVNLDAIIKVTMETHSVGPDGTL